MAPCATARCAAPCESKWVVQQQVRILLWPWYVNQLRVANARNRDRREAIDLVTPVRDAAADVHHELIHGRQHEGRVLRIDLAECCHDVVSGFLQGHWRKTGVSDLHVRRAGVQELRQRHEVREGRRPSEVLGLGIAADPDDVQAAPGKRFTAAEEKWGQHAHLPLKHSKS
eukprot:15452491-Alexandrium_andersonii.AAC.2